MGFGHSNELSVQNTSNEQARSRIMTIARRENLQIQLTNVNELIGEANCEAHRLELVSRYQKVILGKFATVGSFVKAADAISHGYGNGGLIPY
ncbi:unnamed protein product [Rhizophagus irregularis]|uniref:Uncharacterized protein n=2 Tax=Rhizophagus irregularis TaxID=588596 RepID=A0A916EC51_9GLOM|nr:unnamed protein product [Rhizophagus irregularis]CAB5376072.1 unnamed protein product [Rhizophagus irregularis]